MTDKERIEQEEPAEDPALRRLLGLWRAPAVPDSLDARMMSSFRQVTERRPWWSRLLTLSVPVPLPVAVAALVLLIASALVVVRRPAAPLESPEVAAAGAIQTAELDAPVVTRTSLAGFEPVEDMNVTIVAGDRP